MNENEIPRNLEEAFEHFKTNTDEKELEKWAALPEDKCMSGI